MRPTTVPAFAVWATVPAVKALAVAVRATRAPTVNVRAVAVWVAVTAVPVLLGVVRVVGGWGGLRFRYWWLWGWCWRGLV
ncbi:hypothetical protein HDA44_003667 [Kribbella solani]|uniref:Uncharacterized protein n=1 Tax=Kribbella solani TaxID=236067 RepID=A0A841DU86_9ACTN|nr:hypothetical protein [Kribbella solani]